MKDRYETARDVEGAYVCKDRKPLGQVEIQAEALNLLARIAEALEQQGKPGEVLRRTRREKLERAIGEAEVAAASQRSMAIGDRNPDERMKWAQEAMERAAALRDELAKLEAKD